MVYYTIPPQDSLFYEGPSNERLVNNFIRMLLEVETEGCWIINGDNEPSLLTALEFMNDLTEGHFLWADVVAQHDMLKKRYLTFKDVIDVRGVHWDRRINHVYAFEEVWASLIKSNDFEKAFYHKGDIMYDSLKALFGYGHDLINEIIQISSGDHALNSIFAPIVVVSEDEEEVDSPCVDGYKYPRK